jgi:pyruvate kinase
MTPRHRTKIVATLGPSTDKPGVLEAMLRAGLNIARINAAHGTPESHRERIQNVRRLAKRVGVSVAVLLDLPGPKFRLGKLPPEGRELNRGEIVMLGRQGTDPNVLPLSHPSLVRDIRPGDPIYLVDGTVKLEVEKVRDGKAYARVDFSGKVRSGSGINLPQTQISVRLPTPEDLRWIEFAVKESLDWVGVSFVRNAAEVQMIRRRLGTGPASPLVMAKIEKREALTNLDAIIQAADGVMVARGDLGVETPLEQVPLEQKRIIAKAMELGRPVVTATQMLESMVEHSSPTRAEVTDVANAILDGTDAVMLSAETAIGQHPLKAVEVLSRIAAATEEKYRYETIFKRLSPISKVSAVDALCLSACWLSFDLKASAIVVESTDFQLPFRLARFRPKAPILVSALGIDSLPRFSLAWNVFIRPLKRAQIQELTRKGPVLAVTENSIEIINHR